MTFASNKYIATSMLNSIQSTAFTSRRGCSYLFCLIWEIVSPFILSAQTIPPSIPLAQNIQSLTIIPGDRWRDLPIITLNSQEVINIDFDDMTHQYHRYTYSLQHCDADWTPSDQLLTSDFLDGFQSGNTIDNIHESINTTHLYTHYNIQIPNPDCQPKISGNYRLTVIDEDNDDQPVLQAHFMILKPEMSLSLTASANTDIDNRNAHQQLSMILHFNSLSVTNPAQQIRTVVIQNANPHTSVINPTPQSIRPDALQWTHAPELIFPATNEFRKFEILDPHLPALGIDSITWDGQAYHAYATPCEERRSYVYDQDADGAYLIRNQYYDNPEYLSEYLFVHYTLISPIIENQDIFIGGRFTQYQCLPEYRMTYNNISRTYQATILQKQGYYNYCFHTTLPDNTITSLSSEGNYFQTQNVYDAFVYYRPLGARTDYLVAHQHIDTNQQP